jgi:hypothetical protein
VSTRLRPTPPVTFPRPQSTDGMPLSASSTISVSHPTPGSPLASRGPPWEEAFTNPAKALPSASPPPEFEFDQRVSS